MAQATGRGRRKLRNYLLDTRVQLKFTLVMVVLSSVLTAGLGKVWYGEMRNASEVVRVNAMGTLGDAATNKLDEELKAQDRQRLLILVGFAVLLALLIAIYGIVMTHKFVGPLYKISKHLVDIENNRIYELWDLRKGDQLQEFFGRFKAMHGALRTRTEEDMKLLSKLVIEIEKGEVPKELLPKIRELLQQKGDSLRDASLVTQEIEPPKGL